MDFIPVISGLIALVLYINTLDADFAYDDSRAILKNQDLKPETPVINLVYDDFWGTPLTHSGSHKSYRPLCVLSFRLNYYLGELSPWGYHLGNILLHVIVSILFTYFARIFLHHTFPTLVAGVLFSVHPVHTESVAGVVGRADVGACLFFIGTVISYMKYVSIRDGAHGQMQRFVYFLGVVFFTTCSMLTKEIGVTVLAVCAVYDLFIHHKIKVVEFFQIFCLVKYRKMLEGLLLILFTGLSLVSFRIYFMGNKPPEFAPSDNPASDSDSFTTRTLTFLLLPALNLWVLLCPRILSFDWSMSAIPLVESISDPRNIFSIGFYLTLLYFAKDILIKIHRFKSNYSKPHVNGNGFAGSSKKTASKSSHVKGKHGNIRRNSTSSTDSGDENAPIVSYKASEYRTVDIVIISIAIMFFPFIPASNLFFYVGFVIAERVLYIPSMGFCLIVAHGAYLFYQKFKVDDFRRKLIVVCLVMMLLLMSVKTVLRNGDWKNEERLYRSGIPVNPAKAWGNLANVLNNQKKYGEAETAYRKALMYRGNMADVHYNLGILLQDQKRIPEAMASYENAIKCRPKLSMAHLNLAMILGKLRRYEEAEKIYKHCADLDTSGLKDPRMHETTKIACLYNLGRQYSELNRQKDSIAVYHEAIRRMPSHYLPQSLYNMLGESYMKMENIEKAEHWYREALKSKPDHIPAHVTMAKLYLKKKNYKEAESWHLKALDLEKEDSSVFHHYGQFLADVGRLHEAAEMYKKAVSLSSEEFELMFNAANVFRQVGLNEDAENYYEKAVMLKPEESNAHMNLGAMYHYNKKYEAAEKSYKEALRLKPNDATTISNLQKLQNTIRYEESHK